MIELKIKKRAKKAFWWEVSKCHSAERVGDSELEKATEERVRSRERDDIAVELRRKGKKAKSNRLLKQSGME